MEEVSGLSFCKVRCTKCNYTTYSAQQEGRHVIEESLKVLVCKQSSKALIEVIHNWFSVSGDDAENIFSEIMKINGEEIRFKMIKCMELVK